MQNDANKKPKLTIAKTNWPQISLFVRRFLAKSQSITTKLIELIKCVDLRSHPLVNGA